MARTHSALRWRADLALAFVALIWGTTFVAVKQAITQISPFYFLALRFSLAVACLILLFSSRFRSLSRVETMQGLRGGAVAGVFLWIGYVLQTFGLRYTSASNSGFITGLYIVLVPILGAFIYRQRPARRELGGVALSTIGMGVMTLPDTGGFPSINLGDWLTVGAACAFAVHLLLLSRYSKRYPIEPVTIGQIACAAILSCTSLILEKPVAIWSTTVVSSILLTGVFATALAFALQTWGQKNTSATRTAIIFSLEPVFALLTALAFGEPFRWAAILGGILILSGILVVEAL